MEKTILASALLLCIGLGWALIRRLFRAESAKLGVSEVVSRASEDPNSLDFDGVGPGIHGFGLYLKGFKMSHDPLERDD